ncbi:MAG: DinB family protein [Bryobacteraceae bacterium]
MLHLPEVRAYLDECETDLLAELERASEVLHQNAGRGWTVAQIVHHLIRTEQVMYLIWSAIPRLARWPRLLHAMDGANAQLWKAFGMRTVEAGKPEVSNPAAGRFRAPVFLRPRATSHTCESLIAWRRKVRDRSLRAISRIDDETLNTVRWSHPLLGSYSLIEFAQFLGVHERHHLAQMKRIRESNPRGD